MSVRVPLTLSFLLLFFVSTEFVSSQIPPCATLTVSHSPSSLSVPFGSRGDVLFTIRNSPPSARPGPGLDVDFTVKIVLPKGWAGSANPDKGTVNTNSSQVVKVRVEPERDARNGDLVFSVSGTCVIGQVGPVNDTVPLTVAPDSSPTALSSTLALPTLVVLSALAVVGGLAFYSTRRIRSTLVLSTPETVKAVEGGRGVTFPVVLSNRGRVEEEVSIYVGPLPEGWTALATHPEVLLQAQESRTIHVTVRPPPGAPTGSESEISLTAIGKRTRREAHLVLRVRVSPPG